jgi:hypothetical protein
MMANIAAELADSAGHRDGRSLVAAIIVALIVDGHVTVVGLAAGESGDIWPVARR